MPLDEARVHAVHAQHDDSFAMRLRRRMAARRQEE
jgi:hypothetical protein